MSKQMIGRKMSNQLYTATLYFCGSGNDMSDYKSAKHAVPQLIRTARYRHIGFDGPGGNPNGQVVYELNADGSFHIDTDGRKVVLPNTKQDSSFAAMTGSGVGMTLMKAIKWLEDRLNATGLPITNINLCGHSRGSITALAFAWAVEALFKPTRPNLRVNMFLFDPVLGKLNQFQPRYVYNGNQFSVHYDRLPPVVKNFQGIIAANMAGRMKGTMKKDTGFQSSMPANSPATCEDYMVWVMPGGHNGATKFNLNDGGSWMGKIGLSMAADFLSYHGSGFFAQHVLTPREICEGYAICRLPSHVRYVKDNEGTKDIDFFDKNNEAKTTKYRAAVLGDFSTHWGHDFFVNDHHEIALKFSNRVAYDKISKGESFTRQEVNVLRATMPKTVDLLYTLGMVEKHAFM